MKILLKTTIILLAVLTLGGCMGYHKVSYDSSDIVSCPKRAKTGDIVIVETVSVCDADIYVYVNGTELDPIKEGYYEFTMPDHDVEVTTKIVSNGLA
jgi:hypothetical protein